MKKIKKDTRPVRCYICKRKMYYADSSRFEQEYRLMDEDKDFIGYVHKKCVEKKVKR